MLPYCFAPPSFVSTTSLYVLHTSTGAQDITIALQITQTCFTSYKMQGKLPSAWPIWKKIETVRQDTYAKEILQNISKHNAAVGSSTKHPPLCQVVDPVAIFAKRRFCHEDIFYLKLRRQFAWWLAIAIPLNKNKPTLPTLKNFLKSNCLISVSSQEKDKHIQITDIK